MPVDTLYQFIFASFIPITVITVSLSPLLLAFVFISLWLVSLAVIFFRVTQCNFSCIIYVHFHRGLVYQNARVVLILNPEWHVLLLISDKSSSQWVCFNVAQKAQWDLPNSGVGLGAQEPQVTWTGGQHAWPVSSPLTSSSLCPHSFLAGSLSEWKAFVFIWHCGTFSFILFQIGRDSWCPVVYRVSPSFLFYYRHECCAKCVFACVVLYCKYFHRLHRFVCPTQSNQVSVFIFTL